MARKLSINALGNGLFVAKHHEDALTAREAELAMVRRLGAPEHVILAVQNNLASSYQMVGRDEEALSMRRDTYSGHLKVDGEEHPHTLSATNNYAALLKKLKRFKEVKSLLRRLIPVARRVLGESNELMLRMQWIYAEALCEDPDATLGDLRKAVTTLDEIERIARRVFGGAHPTTTGIEGKLRKSQVALHARETQGEAQDAFRTARAKLAQERSELAQTLADASARPSQDASRGA